MCDLGLRLGTHSSFYGLLDKQDAIDDTQQFKKTRVLGVGIFKHPHLLLIN